MASRGPQSPLLLEIITTFWYGEELNFDEASPSYILTIHSLLREIGVHQIWTSLLPIHSLDVQQHYHDYIGSREKCKEVGY